MKNCRNCGNDISPFVSFGKMPIANAFLTPDQFETEYRFDLQVQFCEKCGLVQLVDQPDPKKMFHENYAFFSSTSNRMISHFKEWADFIKYHFLSYKNPFVVEIGSNDGIMLKNFASANIRHLGIEPSANVAEVASANGVDTICNFFDETLARHLVFEYGKTDAFLSANVMCHIPSIHSIAEGIQIMLKPKGVLIFEDPYLGDIIEKTSYDQMYDEHVFYFSVGSVRNIFGKHGLELIDIEPQNTHGGSMRYTLCHKGAFLPSNSVTDQLKKEEKLKLHLSERYIEFKVSIEKSRNDLCSLLKKIKRDGKRVVGYAATSKSTTITNYCNITSELVEFISDTTPIKQGKFSPGTHIPVLSHDAFANNYPDYALLFGWNHAEEIMEKETAFRASGGKWIVYVPEVKII